MKIKEILFNIYRNKCKTFFIIVIIIIFIVEKLPIIISEKEKVFINQISERCYLSPDNSQIKIIHIILTRFLIEFFPKRDFTKKMNQSSYITNGIRVMSKYLLPSLENQSCKNFIWILILGDKANITYINSTFNYNSTFEAYILYYHDLKKFIKKICKDIDVLITTRIDYDDRIYYDAVNDVRKVSQKQNLSKMLNYRLIRN